MTRENEEFTSIPEQAAHWWVVLRHGEASGNEKREFAEWVTRAPERVEASLRVARVHAAVSRADVRWPSTPAEELIRAARAAPEDTVLPMPLRAMPKVEPKRSRAVPIALGLAASVVLAVCVGWFALTRPVQFQTKVGEQRSILLADGSRITLNTASKIEVRLSAERRVIELVQGQALFEVAQDPKRPFDVQVGDVTARAVGTQFDVDRRATHTVVTIVEGRVLLEGAGLHGQHLPLLTEADQVVLNKVGPGKLQHGVNLTEATAWTQRQLVFYHRPLSEIAEEFNRYNVERIEIRSPALRIREMTGTFRSNDVTSFVAVLAGIPGTRVSSDGAGGYIVDMDAPAVPSK